MRMSEGADSDGHVLKMISLIEQLERLNFYMEPELRIDLVLQSLSESFTPFIVNFHMNKLQATLPQLLNMLVVFQGQTKGKAKETVLVVAFSSGKSKNKKNNKRKNKTKPTGGVSKKKNKSTSKKEKCF